MPPGPGVLTITWLGANRTKIAAAQTSITASRQLTIYVRLTKPGRSLLKHTTKPLRIHVHAAFNDLAEHLYTQTTTIMLAP